MLIRFYNKNYCHFLHLYSVYYNIYSQKQKRDSELDQETERKKYEELEKLNRAVDKAQDEILKLDQVGGCPHSAPNIDWAAMIFY